MRLLRSPLTRAAGRALLWAGLLFLIGRGALAVIAPARERPPAPRLEAPRAAFPGQGAEAFAAGFARAYFAHGPGAGERPRLGPYLTAGLAPWTGSLLQRGSPLTVLQATPAGAVRLDARHALITVRVDLGGRAGSRYLAVPLASSAPGAYGVFDYPSLVPAPALAADPAAPEAPLDAGLENEVRPLLMRFFPAYLGGSGSALSYFAPPGAELRGVAGRFDRVELLTLARVGTQAPGRLVVRALVSARDRLAGQTSLFAYRVSLTHAGRWYVASVDSEGTGQ
ncbi:MAG TPA: conjugal transfer protein [Gaiellaceae bacterium]